jgi:histidinol-phosphate aminotransferase
VKEEAPHMEPHMQGTCKDVPSPARRVVGGQPYASPAPPAAIDLWLNGNEGLSPPAELIERVRGRFGDLVRRYPSVGELEALLAERNDLSPERVLVTAGADDALFRVCMAMLEPGRELVLPTPTFEMLDRYALLAGAEVVGVDWLGGDYPTEAVLSAVTPRTGLIAVVTPNNPTGSVAHADDLLRLREAAPHAVLLVDLAYTEFADEELTPVALGLPNTVALRTLSKAWGLAGLRVGYALGPPPIIRWLRTVGNPYAVSGLSAALAAAWLREGDAALSAFVDRVRLERAELCRVLREIGAEPLPSQANFVLARFPDAAETWNALGRRGIAVRAFPGHPRLHGYLRITCPGERGAFDRLVQALRTTADGTRSECKDER